MDSERCTDSVLDNLKALGYDGPLTEEDVLKSSLAKGISSLEFTEVLLAVCSELKSLCSLSESLRVPSGPDDEETFFLELRALLRELKCIREDLLTPVALKTKDGLLNCLDFLSSELLAARLQSTRAGGEENSGPLPKDPVGKNLALILKAYDLSVPPATVPTKAVMLRLIEKVKESLSGLSDQAKQEVMSAMLDSPLSEEEWSEVGGVNENLFREYCVRRDMMLKRAEVTIQSFAWSSRAQDQASLSSRNRDNMAAKAPVSLGRLVAARQDLLQVRPNSSLPQMRSDLNQVLIGKVPDRGGRPLETRPPPEMPSFKARVEAPKERRDGSARGQRGRGQRGSRVQGGWSSGRGGHRGHQLPQGFEQQQGYGHKGNYSPQGGYPGPRGGYPGPQGGYPGPQGGYSGQQGGYYGSQ